MLKKVKLTGFAALTPTKRVNIDAEIYMNTLGLAVVDGRGWGVKMSIKAGDASVMLPAPSLDDSVKCLTPPRKQMPFYPLKGRLVLLFGQKLHISHYDQQ